MRRVIGLDIHRTFAEAVAWDDGRLIRLGRLDMTRTALEGFGKSLRPSDEVVVEATGNAMAGRACVVALRGPRDRRQSATGEGDRACPREDRQDRRRRSGEPARGRLPAGGLDA